MRIIKGHKNGFEKVEIIFGTQASHNIVSMKDQDKLFILKHLIEAKLYPTQIIFLKNK